MKRTVILFALLLAACSKSGPFDSGAAAPVSGESYTLQGTLQEETRTSFQEQENGRFKMFWSLGDEIGIFSYDLKETANINVRATLKESSVGSVSGEFIPETLIIPSWNGDIEGGVAMPKRENETFLVYYPYRDRTDIDVDDRCIHSTLEKEQVQNAVSDREIGKNGFSYAYATVNPAEKKIDFKLNSAMACLRIVLNSTEFETCCLRSVCVHDAGKSACLTGDFVFDTRNREIRPVEGRTFPSVKVSVPVPDFSVPAAGSELYLTIFPGDYTGAELYADLCFVDRDGTKITIPVKLDNPGKILPGAIRTYAFDDVGHGTCPFDWYEPVDSRDFLGGRAYGAQNTYCVESGGTLTFDVKLRGDYVDAPLPKYYGILLASDEKDGALISMRDGKNAYEPAPTRKIPSDYKIFVRCNISSGRFGVVAIYDEKYNILWSYMIWKYEVGDPIGDVSYSGIPGLSFMDRALGAGKSVTAAVKDRRAGEGAAYFNWGRKDPFPWGKAVPAHYLKESGVGKDLQYAVSHPNVLLSMSSSSSGNWCENQPKDLWGAEKTIYDPCPEGYRVPDYDVLSLVGEKRLPAEREFGSGDPRYGLQHDGTHLVLSCPFSDASAFGIEKTDGSYDYWLYHGLLWGSTTSWSNTSSDALVSAYAYWSGDSATSSTAKLLQGVYNAAGTSWTLNAAGKMSDACTVRCLKEN